jgi:hypothetical protein
MEYTIEKHVTNRCNHTTDGIKTCVTMSGVEGCRIEGLLKNTTLKKIGLIFFVSYTPSFLVS